MQKSSVMQYAVVSSSDESNTPYLYILQAYYYSHFKRTAEYRAMKRAGKMQMKTRNSIGRSNSSSEGSKSSRLFSDECAMCDEDVGTLIKCDICMRVFHLHCVELDAPPAGIWFCEEC